MTRRNATFLEATRAAQGRLRLIAGLLALTLFSSVALAAAGPFASSDPTLTSETASETASGAIAEELATQTSAESTPTGGKSISASSLPALVVGPDQSALMAPGQAVEYAFSITNGTSLPTTVSLVASSSASFPTTITGPGGSTLTTVPLAAGETTLVAVIVSVPETASVDTVDVTTLYARTVTNVTARARATTTVQPPLRVVPDNTESADPGTDVVYTHEIVNSWPTTRTVSLESTSSSGWSTSVLATDGVTVITSVTVGPLGGRAAALVKVSVPTSISTPATDTITFTATADTSTATATDTTVIRRLDTYWEPTFTERADTFRLTDPVYTKAVGLTTGTVVCFVWKDPLGTVVRTSATSTVDASGTATDQFTSATVNLVGTWSIELHENDAAGPILEARTFAMTYKGEITMLYASDGPNANDTITVSSSAWNQSSEEITGSTMTYLLWWDGDGDDVFSIGDTYIDTSGTPRPYSEDATTHITAVPSIAASSTWTESPPWNISNELFPNQGIYNVSAIWRSSTGAVIDEEKTEFYSIPVLGWPLYALMAGVLGYVSWRKTRGSAISRSRRWPSFGRPPEERMALDMSRVEPSV